MDISSRDISGKFATQSTSRRGKHLNIKGDELLNITAHDHVYFCDLTDIGAEEELIKCQSTVACHRMLAEELLNLIFLQGTCFVVGVMLIYTCKMQCQNVCEGLGVAYILVVRDSSVVRRHYISLLEPSNVRAQCIRKTADLLLQLWVSTFPRFVAIGFYFLSETLI
jgi:hypothetical protein